MNMAAFLLLCVLTLLSCVNSSVDDAVWQLLTKGPWDAREGLMGTYFKGYIWMSGGRYSPPNAANISNSTFYNDVWQLPSSCVNDVTKCEWKLMSTGAFGEGRAYHIMYTHTVDSKEYMYITGGQNLTVFYNDVWRSQDGITWEQVISNNNLYWHARAGLAAISNPQDGYMYLGGGCHDEFPNRVTLNDLWRSKDGSIWEQIIADDQNSLMHPRSGTRAQVLDNILYVVAGEHGFTEITQLADVWKVNLTAVDQNQTNIEWLAVNYDAKFVNRSGHGFFIDSKGIFWVIAGYYDLHDLWQSKDLGVSWELVTRNVFNCEEKDIHCGRYDFWSQLDNTDHLFVYGGDWNWETFGGAYNECWEIDLDEFSKT